MDLLRVPRLLHARPWLVAVLACLLLSAQWLGQVHRIAHAAQHSASADLADWGHTVDGEECRLLDHLGQDLGLVFAGGLAAADLPQAAPAALRHRNAELSARWQRGARAPPARA